MKTIVNLKGAEFFRATYNLIEEVEKYNKVTGAMAIWKRNPTFNGNETDDEKLAIMKEQVKQNWRDMLKSTLHTNAEATYSFVMSLFIVEDEESEPDGMEMLMGALDIIADERVISFFTKLLRSGLLDITT